VELRENFGQLLILEATGDRYVFHPFSLLSV
jgi:hypothetical protein